MLTITRHSACQRGAVQ